MVLLIVDAQKLITNERLYKFNEFVVNVKNLIDTARKNNIEVIYVRHDDGVENELTKGKNGFEIYEKFKPNNGEKDIIIAGLQTDYCIDATIKCGFEHGFNIIVPAYSNTTVDNFFMSAEQSYKYYNEFIWNERYAKCISLEETLRKMK